MAIDAFLKFEGPEVKGDCLVEGHEGELQILSYSWGESNSGSTHAGPGSGTGKVNVQDVNIMMNMDRSIAMLVKHTASGKHFEKATLYSRKASGDDSGALTYLKFEMEDVLVSSVQFGASDGAETATISTSLNFGKFKFTYVPQKEDGSPDADQPAGWDIARSKDNS